MRKVYDIDRLLEEYRLRPRPEPGRLVTLHGIDGMDGYNPSAPIPNGRFPHVFVRAEPRDVEYGSWSVPFRLMSADCWEIEDGLPMFRLEDPCTSMIHGKLVVGGVRIVSRVRNSPMWQTVFMRGDSPAHLEEFARSPAYMKDVRLVELEDGGVGIFTRPWGDPTSSRHIGYTEVPSLDDLTTSVMEEARLLDTQPVDGQWWGANAVYDLRDGKLGVLAHIATWAEGHRHYYPITFVFDRRRWEIVQGPRIIADRSCFPAYDARQPDLADVIFPGWIDRAQGMFFGGLSDTVIGVLRIEDPFREFAPVEMSDAR